MKTLIKILIILLLLSPLITNAATTYTLGAPNPFDNLNTGNPKNAGPQTNTKLDAVKDSNNFIGSLKTGEEGIKYLLVKVAKDIKTVFYILAGIYLLVMIFRLLFTDNTEEEVGKFKKGVTWVTMGIVLMQIVYTFIYYLYDKNITENLAYDLIDKLINPLISLLETVASFFFLAIAIYAFFRIITAAGDEEKIKTGKKSIIYAIVGFIIIKFARKIVEVTYGTLNTGCQTGFGFNFISGSCLVDAKISGFTAIIVQIINWINSFVGIIMLVMIMYAGSLVLLSAGDEDKLKKAKSIILYVILGMVLLVFNYLILTFFLIPDRVI